MLAMYPLTQTLGILLGMYMLAAGMGLLTDPTGFRSILKGFINSPALAYIAAILAFAIGATMVSLHNLWSSPLEIMISLIGWAALIEGILMLAIPKPFFALVGAIPMQASFMKAYGWLVLVFGGLLVFMALR